MRLATSLTLIALLATLTLGCEKKESIPDDTPTETSAANASTPTETSEAPESQAAPESQGAAESQSAALAAPGAAWVDERVKASQARLVAAGKPGELVAASIKAHGGLKTWFSNGPLAFQFRYEPVSKKKIRETHQVIDTWRSRAVHHAVGDDSKRFGWDGEQAWKNYDDEAINPRFWALTPYYFVAVPFVFADEGVNLADAGEITFEDRTYDLVKATFSEGTGDAPDDYYIVYIDRETKRTGGVRYVVSYPGFFPDGGHSPEKFMKYDGEQVIDGITFAKTFRTFKWDAEKKVTGELVTNSTMSNVSFDKKLPSSFFATPEGVTVIEGM